MPQNQAQYNISPSSLYNELGDIYELCMTADKALAELEANLGNVMTPETTKPADVSAPSIQKSELSPSMERATNIKHVISRLIKDIGCITNRLEV